MNRLYSKLAIVNIKKNKLFYIPYIISGILVVSFVYMMSFMKFNKGIDGMFGADQIRMMMNFGLWIILIFAYIFLFYTNSFLIKRRKKEFGVYNMLGMEKRHISRVLAVESIIVALVSIAGGLIVGIAFSKLCLLLYFYIIKIDTNFAFEISFSSMGYTAVAFGILYLLILLYNCFQIRKSNTMELIKGGNVGEREPKTKVILSLIGFACLFAGYYLSITIKNPFTAMLLFFVAVILVIIGTYIVFTTGSIFVLKLLKKNKKFYYSKRHMTAVAGMLYRMKQNAVGLANICILSTMVLVTISTTVGLYAGAEDTVNRQYPAEMNVSVYSSETPAAKSEDGLAFIEEQVKAHNLTVEGSMVYSSFMVMGELDNGTLVSDDKIMGDMESGDILTFITREDFLKCCADYDKTVPELAGDEVFITFSRGSYDASHLDYYGKKYKVKGANLYNQTNAESLWNAVGRALYVVMADDTALNEAYELYRTNANEHSNSFRVEYYVDCSGKSEDKLALGNDMDDAIGQVDSAALFGNYDRLTNFSKEEARIDYYYSFGGLFFLGMACGFMFLVVTVMIIFYKQISEGYDDRERYNIMEKVGMSQAEVKSTISSQVRIVFFFPLVVSYCHLAGSFPMIKLMMSVLFMSDAVTFVISLLITSVIFAAIYYVIFKVTSRTYYDIVK